MSLVFGLYYYHWKDLLSKHLSREKVGLSDESDTLVIDQAVTPYTQ